MKKARIGIVGAGPGGLFTAYAIQKLANANFELTIFEATDRIGGKILTPNFEHASVYYEAGAAEFYDYSKPDDEDTLRSLVRELGLPMSRMGGSAVIMKNKVIANLDDLGDQLGQTSKSAYLQFDRETKDAVTPQEFQHSDFPDGSPGFLCSAAFQNSQNTARASNPVTFRSVLNQIDDSKAVEYIECLIHSDLATEPDTTNVHYGQHNYVMNDPRYMNLYGIDGGNERLPKALGERINANWQLQNHVTQIAKQDDGRFSVDTRGNSESDVTKRLHDFDFVVIALPHNQIPMVNFQPKRLSDAVKKHHEYYNYPAHYLRISILFESRFWKNELTDSYWMLDQMGGCCLYDESSRRVDLSCAGMPDQGVLGWLIGGTSAEEMSRLTDVELKDWALESLPDFLEHGRSQVLECHVHRWIAAVSALPGGGVYQTLDQRHQPEPENNPGLFMVGDYLFDTTLNGALDSANYVGSWIARILNTQEF